MTGISYFIIHMLALILPGWIIVRVLGFTSGRPVFILATSYIYYVLLAALSKWLDLPLNSFIAIYILLFLAIAVFSLRFHSVPEEQPYDRHWLTGLLLVICSYFLYRYLAGPYTEVPADFLHHMEFARAQLDAINENHLGVQRDFPALLKQGGGIWYSFYALITSLTGLEFIQTLPWATLANGLVYLCAVYGFAWYVFGHFTISKNHRLAATLFATLFTATHLGLNVFAYLRYYALAPTMLNMVIYFAAIIAILDLLRGRGGHIQHTLIYPGLFVLLSLIASTLVHNQEGLFILVTGGLMLGWFALYPASRNTAPVILLQRSPVFAYRIILLIFIMGFLSLVIWTYTHYERPTVFFNKIIQLSEKGPIFNRILFLNPAYQGYQVITSWGILVYGLFIIYWRKFIGHPYLFAGMLTPLFTVFNPVFVDWFMRMDNVHTLWRMLYLIPLHFVAGLLVVFLFNSAARTRVIWRKLGALLAITLLVALLFPLPGINSNSRLTLARVDHNNSYLYWQDLIEYLNQQQLRPVSILTDPVTGYVLNGMTRHRTYYHKFFNNRWRPFNFTDYSDAPLARYKGWLLVVNDRDGGNSETGEYAKHWPKNILKTSDFYKQPLREHIRTNNKNRFEKVWENDNIHVYMIR